MVIFNDSISLVSCRLSTIGPDSISGNCASGGVFVLAAALAASWTLAATFGTSDVDSWRIGTTRLIFSTQSGWILKRGDVKVAVKETVRETFCPKLKNGIDSPSSRMCKLNERKKLLTADARTMIDDSTTKDTMGWMDRARMSCWVWGGFEGEGSWWSARVEIKIAPTPICGSR